MKDDYTNISDIYRTVVGCDIIDLIPYVSVLEPELLDTLDESTLGLYLPNSIEPFFHKDHKYQYASKNSPLNDEEIKFNDIINDITCDVKLAQGDIYNLTTEKLIKRSIYENIKKKLTINGDKQVKACEIAIAVVLNYLNTLCPKYTHVATRHYDLVKIVKPEYHYLIDKREFEKYFYDLIQHVSEFVKSDTWNIYYYKVIGTTLILEKGLDFRIADWYINKIKVADNYDHDFGGINDGLINS